MLHAHFQLCRGLALLTPALSKAQLYLGFPHLLDWSSPISNSPEQGGQERPSAVIAALLQQITGWLYTNVTLTRYKAKLKESQYLEFLVEGCNYQNNNFKGHYVAHLELDLSSLRITWVSSTVCFPGPGPGPQWLPGGHPKYHSFFSQDDRICSWLQKKWDEKISHLRYHRHIRCIFKRRPLASRQFGKTMPMLNKLKKKCSAEKSQHCARVYTQ